MSKQESFVLGIDIGTGSTKTVAVTLPGTIIGNSQVSYKTLQTSADQSEQDPQTIIDAVFESIRLVMEQVNVQPLCLSFSCAMHGIMAVDENDQPLTNLITWQDRRSRAIAKRLMNGNGLALYEETGTPVHPMSPLCKLIWMRENEAVSFEKTKKFISIKEYLWFKLFGIYEIDHSMASATGLFHIENRQWHQEALKLAGIHPSQLSLPVRTKHCRTNVLPDAASLMNVDQSVQICIGATDGCLANLGSLAMDKGVAAITIGTSGAVRIASTRPIRTGEQMTFNYILDESQYICGSPVNNGGNIMQWLTGSFLKHEVNEEGYNKVFQAFELVLPGSEGLLFLPYLYGERAPVWDAAASGVYFGIRPHHTSEHFTRSTIEGICYALRQAMEILEVHSGPLQQLIASGGFVKSDPWMQLLADITAKNIVRPPEGEASATGAAYLGMQALGMASSLDHPVQSDAEVFVPNTRHVLIHESNYQLYKQLYPAFRQVMSKQNPS